LQWLGHVVTPVDVGKFDFILFVLFFLHAERDAWLRAKHDWDKNDNYTQKSEADKVHIII